MMRRDVHVNLSKAIIWTHQFTLLVRGEVAEVKNFELAERY